MSRIRTLTLAVLALASTATIVQAQVPGTFLPTPTSSISLAAVKAESFAMTLSSTVQSTALAIADSTAGASQQYAGAVTLTPTWDLSNNRNVTIYAYVSSPFTTGATSFPSSVLEASAAGGSGSANGSWNAFSSTVDGHGSAVTLTSLTVTGASKKVTDASEAVAVSLRLNTTNTYIEPGAYTGVVTFAAHVQ
ncbi:MAG TPA: hypothetical protein VJU87_00415 [Gemmatimonadaceae bacterium]|nr:hypothetical protein [Gemmatimonadaceae bacterium]